MLRIFSAILFARANHAQQEDDVRLRSNRQEEPAGWGRWVYSDNDNHPTSPNALFSSQTTTHNKSWQARLRASYHISSSAVPTFFATAPTKPYNEHTTAEHMGFSFLQPDSSKQCQSSRFRRQFQGWETWGETIGRRGGEGAVEFG